MTRFDNSPVGSSEPFEAIIRGMRGGEIRNSELEIKEPTTAAANDHRLHVYKKQVVHVVGVS